MTIQELKQLFSSGKKPTGTHFASLIDFFRAKTDTISAEDIEGLDLSGLEPKFRQSVMPAAAAAYVNVPVTCLQRNHATLTFGYSYVSVLGDDGEYTWEAVYTQPYVAGNVTVEDKASLLVSSPTGIMNYTVDLTNYMQSLNYNLVAQTDTGIHQLVVALSNLQSGKVTSLFVDNRAKQSAGVGCAMNIILPTSISGWSVQHVDGSSVLTVPSEKSAEISIAAVGEILRIKTTIQS